MCVLNQGHSRHSDEELGLEFPKRIASTVKGFDVNVILEGRGEGWDIETEDTVPHLTDSAGWERAVSITSGAGEVLVEDISASEVAFEMNVVHDGAIDVPDTLDIEFLVVGGLDGIGVSVGAIVERSAVKMYQDVNMRCTTGIMAWKECGELCYSIIICWLQSSHESILQI